LTNGRRPAKETAQAWAAGVVLTFFGVFVVLAAGAFAMAYLTPVMGPGT